jgi:transposase
MDAYSLDLRKKIVDAKQRGMPTSEVAKTFGVGASTVKRYAAAAREGRPLAPKKRPGSEPKAGRGGQEALGAGHGGAPGGHPAPEARVPASGLWA